MNKFIKKLFSFGKVEPEQVQFSTQPISEIIQEKISEVISEIIPEKEIIPEEIKQEEIISTEEPLPEISPEELIEEIPKLEIRTARSEMKKKRDALPEHMRLDEHYIAPFLSEDQKLDLISKIAMYWKSTKIITHFIETYRIQLNDYQIASYKKSKEWALVIDRMRQEYIAGIMEVPIANKRWRLEEYEGLYHALKELDEHSKAAAILDLVRGEMEEKKGSINNLYLTQVNVSDEELADLRLKSINELESIRKRKLITKGETINVQSTSQV